jgi:hypothetical protein
MQRPPRLPSLTGRDPALMAYLRELQAFLEQSQIRSAPDYLLAVRPLGTTLRIECPCGGGGGGRSGFQVKSGRSFFFWWGYDENGTASPTHVGAGLKKYFRLTETTTWFAAGGFGVVGSERVVVTNVHRITGETFQETTYSPDQATFEFDDLTQNSGGFEFLIHTDSQNKEETFHFDKNGTVTLRSVYTLLDDSQTISAASGVAQALMDQVSLDDVAYGFHRDARYQGQSGTAPPFPWPGPDSPTSAAYDAWAYTVLITPNLPLTVFGPDGEIDPVNTVFLDHVSEYRFQDFQATFICAKARAKGEFCAHYNYTLWADDLFGSVGPIVTDGAVPFAATDPRDVPCPATQIPGFLPVNVAANRAWAEFYLMDEFDTAPAVCHVP